MAEDGMFSEFDALPLEELTGDARLFAELLRGASLVDAAKAAGMPERTARRHVGGQEFTAELDEARRELWRVVAAGSVADYQFGRSVLREIAGDADAPAASRVNAVQQQVGISVQAAAAGQIFTILVKPDQFA